MKDNYPEEHELDKIKNWTGNYGDLLDYCLSLWTFKDWATKHRGGKYRFATGGWSGNESIIYALEENKMFWMACWELSQRGGLYKFKLPTYMLPKKKTKPKEYKP